MAEFWWGASPRGEVRRHGNFYPSCNSKCKPILLYMMQGLEVDENPLEKIIPSNPTILWEDESMVVINKPEGMLSVEGKSGVRSAEQWAKERYPMATGPMIVHRLDQSTSGILLIAKDKEAHKALQEQFISHTIKKEYTALLEGRINSHAGRISLPLKLDYEHRPRQMVAQDGRSAVTEYEVLSISDNRTLIRFRPLTGRTHQLRVHSAHDKGLGCPIVGDDIYGYGGRERLHLHASRIEFRHPLTQEPITILCEAPF
jgi:tRNA pseudouridine32 synthase/23S rRNA pseudouridine746 synthase